MSTYLYCVLTPPEIDRLPSRLAGIAGALVRSLVLEGHDAIEAWVATVDETALRARGEALAAQALLHNEIVNAALATGRTPAPARYGSRFADDAACLADLGQRRRELSSVLERVADAVEMAALLVPTARSPAPVLRPKSGEPSAGRRYLDSIRTRAHEEERQRTAADAEASRISSLVHSLVRDEQRSSRPSAAMSIAHLVPRVSVAEYLERMRSFEPIGPFRLVIGDVRAPYSFASRKPGVTGHDSGSPNRSD